MKLYFFLLLSFLAPSLLFASPKSTNVDTLDALQTKIVGVSNKVTKSVVHIKAVLRQHNRKMEAFGSGLLLDKQGNVVTNQHVVDRAESIKVHVPGIKKPFTAVVKGEDKQTDLALLKFDPKKIDLPVAPQFGDSDKVKVGEWVLAVGNPYGLEGTVSFGIVSAKGRNLPISQVINDFIQTDAMIDFGSSGGPLVNMNGEVIGINSRTQGRGIGFTIPASMVQRVRERLAKSGKMERSWLGLTIQPLSRDLATYFAISKQTGVVVNSVVNRSPAQKAKLKVGDILTHFDGSKIAAENDKEILDVVRLIASTGVGKKVRLNYIRQGKKRKTSATLAAQPRIEDNEKEIESLGISIKDITNDLFYRDRLPTRNGVYVSFVDEGSVARQAGLVRGDIVTKVASKNVQSVKSFEKATQGMTNDKQTLFIVRRGRDQMYFLIKK